MKDVLIFCAGICCFVGFILLFIRTLLYLYIEMVNDYGGYMGYRRSIESILPYSKKVRNKDEALKRLMNVVLRASWSIIGLAIIFAIISSVVP